MDGRKWRIVKYSRKYFMRALVYTLYITFENFRDIRNL